MSEECGGLRAHDRAEQHQDLKGNKGGVQARPRKWHGQWRSTPRSMWRDPGELVERKGGRHQDACCPRVKAEERQESGMASNW